MLLPPHLVARRAEMLRDVERVEGNQRVGVLAYRPDVGRPHVHRHHLDVLAARLAHRVDVAVKGRPVATVGHIQHARLRLRQVIDHRDIFAPPRYRRGCVPRSGMARHVSSSVETQSANGTTNRQAIGPSDFLAVVSSRAIDGNDFVRQQHVMLGYASPDAGP